MIKWILESPLFKPLRMIAHNILVFLGYDIYLIKYVSSSIYTTIHPLSTYSPWNIDKMFMKTYEMVKHNTLVDRYRCFELWSLVEQVRKSEGAIIEIGVWRGGTGALIAQKAELCGIKDNVYLCDTFTGIAKAGENDSAFKDHELANTSVEIVEKLVNQLGLNHVKILKGIFPEESSHNIKEKKIRFCHIDVDVYQSAKDILNWVWDKMSVGGIVVYDDYGFEGCNGITKHVEEHSLDDDKIYIYNLNGHAIFIKKK